MATEWFVGINGTQHGPLSSSQMRDMAAAGKIGPDDLVWRDGLAEWMPASQIQGLVFSGKQLPVSTVTTPSAPAASQSTKFCHACAATIDQRAEICPKCGVRQSSSHASSENHPNRVVAALLALFFGMLGAHKFYLGQSGMGVLYLGLSLGGVILSCLVIPLAGPIVIAIVSVVEGLIYLSYSERGFRERFGS